MNAGSESTDRNAVDYAHFALICGGLLFSFGGVVTLSRVIAMLGLVVVGLGMAYFLTED
jgi:hypothetical protein